MPKVRLDVLLVTRGLADSRARAQALVMAGDVSTDDRRLDKPGMMVEESAPLNLRARAKYASRAGDKLASVAKPLGLVFAEKLVLDVGSSTGGFTDYALQNGASHVWCVDVGTGQLVYRLRNDERVTVMERTDIRNVEPQAVVDMAVVDVSFISLLQVLEATASWVRVGGLIVAMAKPQFEVGKPVADKYHGVVPVGPERDSALDGVREWIVGRWKLVGEADSLVSGAEGNVEHFFAFRR